MAILLTGFAPFGGMSTNPSGEIARALDGDGVTGACLPVDHERFRAPLAELLARDWEAVVLMGVAVKVAELNLERVAINFRDTGRPDNSGRAPETTEVVPGGPAAYFSTLPLEDLRDDLARAGLPVTISLTAGAYLCNASFYFARHHLDARSTPCGFVHIPATPAMGTNGPSLAMEEQIRGVRLILDRLSTGAARSA